MTVTERQLAEDRALRDSALRLVKTDLALVRADVSARGPGTRAADRIGDAAMDTFEDALDYAQDHRAQVGGVVAAILLWFFRGPILGGLAALVGANDDDRDDDDEREDHRRDDGRDDDGEDWNEGRSRA